VAKAAVCALVLEASNSLRALVEKASASREGNVSLIKEEIAHGGKDILDRMEEDMRRLFDHGAKLIPDGASVLTHCHSSTSTGALIEAKRQGKDLKVVCFETRPRYQGRKTAAELAKAGIDTTLTVDGAMTLFMKKADMCLVGADSITSRGDLINKIGTSTLAHIARMHDVSFYCAAELSKFSPKTIFGEREEIEERDPSEVWDRRPRRLRIRNPAFEATAAKYVSGYVTEVGVIPPQSFLPLAIERLGIKLYG